jgi:hypothetical protein
VFIPLNADKFSSASLYMYETGLFDIGEKLLNTHFQGNLEINHRFHLYTSVFSFNEFLEIVPAFAHEILEGFMHYTHAIPVKKS